MGLVEAVPPERLDLRGELLDDPRLVPARDRLLGELTELLLDQVLVLLPHRLAQDIGFGERDAGEHLRDPHHLFLIGDDAIRRLEDRPQLGERVRDWFLAALPPLVDAMHSRVQRSRSHQRAGRHQVVEPVAAHRAQHVGGQGGLELEDANRATQAEHAVGVGVGRVDLRQVRCGSGPRPDRLQRVMNDGQRRQAQEVHLEHAGLLERRHVVLRDDDPGIGSRESGIGNSAAIRLPIPHSRFPLRFHLLRHHGHVLVQRSRGDDYTRGMHAGVPRESLQRDRIVQQPVIALVVAIQLRHLGDLLDGLAHRQRIVRLVRDQLGQRIGLGRREAEHAAHILHRGPRLERPEGHDLPNGVLPVLLADVVDHLAAPLEAEVDVDVRHRDAFRVQEALEQQVVDQGVDVGDA